MSEGLVTSRDTLSRVACATTGVMAKPMAAGSVVLLQLGSVPPTAIGTEDPVPRLGKTGELALVV